MTTKPTSFIEFGEIEERDTPFFSPGEVAPTYQAIKKGEEEPEKEVEEEPELILAGTTEKQEEEDVAEQEGSEDKKEEEEGGKEATTTTVEEALEDPDTDYKKLTLELIATGQWEEFEPEEGVSIKDIENLSKEDFEVIAKTQQKWKEDKIKEDALKNLSEEEREFIEYKKTGGDLNEFIRKYLTKQQATNLDISNDTGQKNAVYVYYKNMLGWEDERIIKHINRLEKDLELEDEAKLAKEKVEEKANEQYQEMIQKQQEALEKVKENQKKYKTGVRESLKNSVQDKKRVDSIVKALTETDERGYAAIDRAYIDVRNNPEKAELLYNVLLDYENWEKSFSQKKVNDANLETFRRIKLNKESKSGSEIERKKETGKKLVIQLSK